MPRTSTIHRGVKLGKGASLFSHIILGHPAKDKTYKTLTIGPEATIRPFSVIYLGSIIGARFATGHYSVVRENNHIGDDVSLGITAELAPGNVIGNRVRIHSGCFLEMVTVGDDVFIGPNTVFLDDPHPMCPRYLECVGGATVEHHVSIGGNVTVLPGIRIGHGALIGAGSVVTKDVPPEMVVAGNPAKVVKKVKDLTCPPKFFSRPYIWRESGPLQSK